MARGNVFGYETYMIRDGSLRNVYEGSHAIGFQLELRIANYRGYILSQVEDIRVSVDGTPVPREAIRFGVGGRVYTLAEMETVVDDRWELRQVATVTCLQPGGLAAGPHRVTVEEHIRASYIPFVAVAQATKSLRIE